jgi:hypothetical protein
LWARKRKQAQPTGGCHDNDLLMRFCGFRLNLDKIVASSPERKQKQQSLAAAFEA